MEKTLSTLATALRPRKMEEIIGQKWVVRSITERLKRKTIPIAWLLAGPTGSGKTTIAHIIANGIGTLLWEINASDLNGVEEARKLAEAADYQPLNGQRNVVILDEAQKLTEAAQNVLLKPFENPNGATVFIICTTAPDKIIKPLRDRCLSFTLKCLDKDEILQLVERGIKFVKKADDKKDLYTAIIAAGIDSPREILNAVERWASGMPPAEAAQVIEETHADFIDIARTVAAGTWEKTRTLLIKVKPQDTLALRGIVAGYLKTILIKNEMSLQSDVYSKCLQEFGKYPQAFQDGTTHPITIAILYNICEMINTVTKPK
jgi:DNA polymerase III gamma/tau subunit